MRSTHLMLLAIGASAGFQPQAEAQSTIDLGSASSFAVLGSTMVTNTGSTVVNGDLGLYSGTSVTGFATVDGGPGMVNGAIDVDDIAAMQAQSAAAAAYNMAMAQTITFPSVTAFTNTAILTPGVYNASSTLQLSGTITLSGSGVYIFQIGSALNVASGTVITLANGAQADDVFLQVGSSSTLETSSDFVGAVLAEDSITVDTGATVDGGLFALTAAVTLDDNNLTAVPEPADTSLLISGFGGLIVGVRTFRRRYYDRKLELRRC